MKDDYLKRSTTQDTGNANTIDEGGTATLSPPVLQFQTNDSNSTRSPCDRRVDTGEGMDDHRDRERELNKRHKLKEAYTQQTILELITLKSDDHKGSLDPYTQFIHTLYSPGDELEKGIETIEDVPGIKRSIDNAFKSGDPETLWDAAGKVWDGFSNLPSRPGMPSLPKKGDGIKEIYDKLKTFYDLYEAMVVKGEIGEDVCDVEEQIRSKVGKVIEKSWILNKVVFMSSKNGTLIGRYSDIPSDQWFEDIETGTWYIKSGFLPTYEAMIEARE